MKKITLFLGSILAIANIFGSGEFYGPPALTGRIADISETPINWPANLTYLKPYDESIELLENPQELPQQFVESLPGKKVLYIPSSKCLTIKTATNPVMGKGVFAKTDLKAGTIIGLYLGEEKTIDFEHHTINGKILGVKKTTKADSSYFYNLSNNKQSIYLRQSVVDAKYAGNEIRFINHKKNGNVMAIGLSKKPDIYMQITKDVSAGSELFFDYTEEYWCGMLDQYLHDPVNSELKSEISKLIPLKEATKEKVLTQFAYHIAQIWYREDFSISIESLLYSMIEREREYCCMALQQLDQQIQS